jgi:hypothetical protein
LTQWSVTQFRPIEGPEWDTFISESDCATFQHTRKFLSYHGNRFQDISLVIRDSNGKIAGVIAAAQDGHDQDTVISHPGATFGGLVASAEYSGTSFRTMMNAALHFWLEHGYRSLRYKVVPVIYHRRPYQEDQYVLWSLGARTSRRTLSACLDLVNRPAMSSRRKRSLQKAQRVGITLRSGLDVLPELWPIVETGLRDRHNVDPVHSLAEIQFLAAAFEDQIECIGAYSNGTIVGGVVLLLSPLLAHVQYSVSSHVGMTIGAMDILISHSIESSLRAGRRYFDLGISTDHTGLELNDGLHSFKMGFGAGTILYDHLELDLSSAPIANRLPNLD